MFAEPILKTQRGHSPIGTPHADPGRVAVPIGSVESIYRDATSRAAKSRNAYLQCKAVRARHPIKGSIDEPLGTEERRGLLFWLPLHQPSLPWTWLKYFGPFVQCQLQLGTDSADELNHQNRFPDHSRIMSRPARSVWTWSAVFSARRHTPLYPSVDTRSDCPARHQRNSYKSRTWIAIDVEEPLWSNIGYDRYFKDVRYLGLRGRTYEWCTA
ncbi:hypothetical protein BJ956_000600 [Arthrobacter psychrochitiniphilus]|nr:hypothetical protein [Arthrobacter psychrochitiniphilus]